MIPAWIDPESWEAFRVMRKAIKAPLSPYAEKLIVMQLVRLKAAGEDPQACLDQSIMLCWRDVFPVRDKNIRQGATAAADTAAYLAEMGKGAAPCPPAVAEKLKALRRVA
jgi:hypothetical protein